MECPGTPNEFDVLCGSGKFVFTHPGNIRLRRIIDEHIDVYLDAAAKPDRTEVVHRIVKEVFCVNGRQFRVLKKRPIFDDWYEVPTAKKKVLRDKITSILRVISKKREEEAARLRRNDDRESDPSDGKLHAAQPFLSQNFVW